MTDPVRPEGMLADEIPCNMSEDDAITAIGIPAFRSIIRKCYCIAKSAREVNSTQGTWEVTAIFDSDPPLTKIAEWYWDGETIEKVIEKDPVTLQPIVNSVGEPLFSTRPATIQVLTVEKILTTWDSSEIDSYCDHVNSATFWGKPAGTALMHSIREAPVYRRNIRLSRVVYVIKFDLNPELISIVAGAGTIYHGWNLRLLNHGSVYYDPVAGSLRNFEDTAKNPTTGNLKLNGERLNPQNTAPNAMAIPIYLDFNRFPRKDFNVLNLGPIFSFP
jgi:hypothetical protein